MTEGTEKTINKSESITLKRSDIHTADYNPRTIDEEAIKKLRKGLKTFGLVGGIVVNKRTGNTLISGHQRLSILDSIQHFPDNDYSIRVDVVDLDEKREKELNILMNNPNAQGEWNYNLLASIVPDIDPIVAGLSEADLAFIGASPIPDIVEGDKGESIGTSIDSDFVDLSTLVDKNAPKTYEEALRYEAEKRRLSNEKRKTLEKANSKAQEHYSYLCLSFSSFESKTAFCQRFGIPPMETTICGEDFGEDIERIS